MKKKHIVLSVLSVLLLVGVGFGIWTYVYWQPWKPYLNDEPMEHPDGIVKTENGETYGWGDGADVYEPEYVETGVTYEHTDSYQDWFCDRAYMDGELLDPLHLEEQLLELGWVEDKSSRSDVMATYTNESNARIELMLNDFGYPYKIDVFDTPVNFIEDSTIVDRRGIKNKLGCPIGYSWMYKDKIQYTWSDTSGQSVLVLTFDTDTDKLIASSYTWGGTKGGYLDNNGDYKPYREPTSDEVKDYYYEWHPMVDETWEAYERRTGHTREEAENNENREDIDNAHMYLDMEKENSHNEESEEVTE